MTLLICKCESDQEIYNTGIFLIDHWSPYASINMIQSQVWGV